MQCDSLEMDYAQCLSPECGDDERREKDEGPRGSECDADSDTPERETPLTDKWRALIGKLRYGREN